MPGVTALFIVDIFPSELSPGAIYPVPTVSYLIISSRRLTGGPFFAELWLRSEGRALHEFALLRRCGDGFYLPTLCVTTEVRKGWGTPRGGSNWIDRLIERIGIPGLRLRITDASAERVGRHEPAIHFLVIADLGTR